MDYPAQDLVPQQRAALVAIKLHQGAALTPLQVAALCGVSGRQAYNILDVLSCILPIYRDEDHLWRWLAEERR